jgi:hypothetical protein
MAEEAALEEMTFGTLINTATYKKTLPEANRIRPAKALASLVGSGRGRRHSHRRARSAPACGFSSGPRASWVRVPLWNHTTAVQKVVSVIEQVLSVSFRTGPEGPVIRQPPVGAADRRLSLLPALFSIGEVDDFCAAQWPNITPA